MKELASHHDDVFLFLVEDASLPEWDAFVEQHPLGTVWHLSEWRNHLQGFFQHIRGGFLAIRNRETGRIQAGLPLYEARSKLFGARMVSVPYATFCDPLISSAEDFPLLLEGVRLLGQGKGVHHAEIRTLGAASNSWDSDYIIGHRFKHHRLIIDGSAEKLRRNFCKRAITKKIIKAEQLNISIRKQDEDFDLFIKLIAQGRRGLGLLPLPSVYFQSLRRHVLARHRTFMVAFLGEKPVGALLVFKCGRTHILESIAEIDAARNLGVNQLLYWRAIEEACAEGAECISFGRTDLENTGLLTYKKRWGTAEEDLDVRILFMQDPKKRRSSTHKIRSKYSNHVRGFIRSCPMPVLQLFSNLFFRHWT